MTTGETGYLGLQENIEDEIQKGNDIITNAAVPRKIPDACFASPKAHGSYQGFKYDAIAIAYENADIVMYSISLRLMEKRKELCSSSRWSCCDRSFFGVMGKCI